MEQKCRKKILNSEFLGQAYFRKILEIGEKEGFTFYLLGGTKEVCDKTRSNLIKLYPNIKIVGNHDGYLDCQNEQVIIDEINSLKPNVLFVAMGAPKQEKWIYENRHKLKVDIATGQGGTFDYEAGNIKRAPVFIQKIGMEWFWRLILQPKRIIRMSVLPIYVLKLIFSKDKTKGKFTNVSL